MRSLVAAAILLALTGCVERIAESRVRSALIKGGVPDPTAECMAGRMVDRLTISQLRKLERIKDASGRYRLHSVADYLEAVRRVGDPEVVGVTATSAALCATGLAR